MNTHGKSKSPVFPLSTISMDPEPNIIPQYFLCPISLQMMKDPVTTVTGITYDRESIEHWLSDGGDGAACPVTKQKLPRDTDLTPNHMLRRLIQAWCIANAENGIDRIPTPKSPLDRRAILRLVKDVNRNDVGLMMSALTKLVEHAAENDRNRKFMADNGVVKALVPFISKCFREEKTTGIEEAVRILKMTWFPTSENREILVNNLDFIESLIWILSKELSKIAKTHALEVLKNAIEISTPCLKERLDLNFFKHMVNFLRDSVSEQGTRSVLRILIETLPYGANKTRIIACGAVFASIELELGGPEKRTTELVFCMLAHLCSCAEGRQELLRHPGGIAVAAKRMLRVTASADDRIMCVMEQIARFSATREVVMEMLRVGAVAKLCMVLQADCDGYLKKKAREILRLHSHAWSNSPCIQVYLLTRYAR